MSLIGLSGINGVGKGTVIKELIERNSRIKRLSSTQFLMQYFGILTEEEQPTKEMYARLGQISQAEKLAALESPQFQALLQSCKEDLDHIYILELHLAVPQRGNQGELETFVPFLPRSYGSDNFDLLINLISEQGQVHARRASDQQRGVRERGPELINHEAINEQDLMSNVAWLRLKEYCHGRIPCVEILNQEGALGITINNIEEAIYSA